MAWIKFLFYLYKAFIFDFDPFKKCNNGKTLDGLAYYIHDRGIESIIRLLKQKVLLNLGPSEQTLRKIVPYIIEVPILFFPSLLSTNLSATFLRSSISVNSL